MDLMRDGMIAFFSAVGLTTVVWLLAGVLVRAGRPGIPGLLLVLPLKDEAPAMESDVRTLRRLRHQLPGSRIVLADCGLQQEARGLAEYLSCREEVLLWNGLGPERENETKEGFHARADHL